MQTILRKTAALGAAFIGLGLTAHQSQAQGLVISQVYGGGGLSSPNAPYAYDFVELYNNTGADINLSSYSIQYAGTTSTAPQAAKSATLTGVIKSGGYYLIEGASPAAVGSDLPTPDFVLLGLDMGNTAGQIALLPTTAATLYTSADFNGANPKSTSFTDFVGFGTGTTRYEGTGPTVSPNHITSVIRSLAATPNTGYLDTNNNSTDFVATTVTPHNSASPGVGIAATPEPSSVAGMLIGVGLLGAVIARRRRICA